MLGLDGRSMLRPYKASPALQKRARTRGKPVQCKVRRIQI